ncbi:MAG: hypothetical protein JO360_08770 [Acidobacteria bacterium]|nr:hypothetical protein [Acidobacteriota bacterium]
MKCPYCERPLRALSLRCRVCDRFVPRLPHLFVLGLLAVAALIGVILFLEYLAKSR